MNKYNNLYRNLVLLLLFRYLPMTQCTQETFLQYFSDGMGPSEARRAHENSLLIEDNCLDKLASGASNPTANAVDRLYKSWKASHFGTAEAPLCRLREKIVFYSNRGSISLQMNLCAKYLCSIMSCSDIFCLIFYLFCLLTCS